MAPLVSGCVRTDEGVAIRSESAATTTGERPQPTQSTEDAGPAAPGIVTTIAHTGPARTPSAVRSRSSRRSRPSHRYPIRRPRRSPLPSRRLVDVEPGSGDVGLRMQGPDGMFATVTIAQTKLDPAEAFTEYADKVMAVSAVSSVSVLPAELCGYSGQKLMGAWSDTPQQSVEFLDRIAHIWTNTDNYLVAVHVQAPGRNRRIRCRLNGAHRGLRRRHTLKSCSPSSSSCPADRFGWVRRASIRKRRRSTPCRSAAFAIERHPVTNAQFAEFVDETGYVTVAEQELDPALYPGAESRRSGAGCAGVPADVRAGGSAGLAAVVGVETRRVLAASVRAGQRNRGPAGPSGRAGRLSRCGRLCALGRTPAAERGRMGVRGARRQHRRPIRGATIATPDGQLMANTWQGQFPVSERRCAGLDGHVAGRDVSAERLRPGRHDRQRLGVDDDRVRRAPPPRRTGARVLSAELTADPIGQPGAQGWLAPVRAGVLPPVPACGALAAVAGQRDHAHRIPLRGRYTPRRRPRIADIVTAVSDKKYRVILWGPGSIGSELLTAIIDHRDDLEIVGVKVYSDSKNGVDAGKLVGRDPIGVTATKDVDEIVALDADCVIYTPRNGDLDEVCRLLASGKNVATTVFLFYPPRLPDADRQRLEAACREGNTHVSRQRHQPRQPVGCPTARAVRDEPHHRQDHPSGTRRHDALRQHRHQLRQHEVR